MESLKTGCPTPDKEDMSMVNDREIDNFGEMAAKRLQQPQKQLSAEEIAKVISEYESGKTTYELAETFGCHRQTITSILKRYGVKVDKCTVRKRLNTDEIIALYAGMHTSTEIAKHYKVHPQVIIRCLKANGVKIRSRWDY